MKYVIALVFSLLFAQMTVAQQQDLWIDVRTVAEHQAKNIKGDLNIPLDQLAKKIGQHAYNKDTYINLYCRSGRRAESAKNMLTKMGYKNVTNHKTMSQSLQARQ